MKNLIALLVILIINFIAFGAEAQNAAQAKIISDALAVIKPLSNSTSPNKAFVYKSSRNDVDATELVENLNITILPTQVQIQRPAGDSTPLTNCTADVGTASVNATTVIINSSTLPIRVICTNSDGSLRHFFSTYFKL